MVCRDRYSVEVGAGDVSVGLPGFAGLDCVGGQTGEADMGDIVCTGWSWMHPRADQERNVPLGSGKILWILRLCRRLLMTSLHLLGL